MLLRRLVFPVSDSNYQAADVLPSMPRQLEVLLTFSQEADVAG